MNLERKIALNHEVSAITQGELPPKLKDPGSFVTPCKIRELKITKALCDLRESVSLMPLLVCSKLVITKLSSTNMTL